MKLPVEYAALTPARKRAVREEYVRVQGGNCHYCMCPLNEDPPPEISQLYIHEPLFPKGFFMWPIHLHHCHDTGLTIGAVHARCNAVLWQYFEE